MKRVTGMVRKHFNLVDHFFPSVPKGVEISIKKEMEEMATLSRIPDIKTKPVSQVDSDAFQEAAQKASQTRTHNSY